MSFFSGLTDFPDFDVLTPLTVCSVFAFFDVFTFLADSGIAPLNVTAVIATAHIARRQFLMLLCSMVLFFRILATESLSRPFPPQNYKFFRTPRDICPQNLSRITALALPDAPLSICNAYNGNRKIPRSPLSYR